MKQLLNFKMIRLLFFGGIFGSLLSSCNLDELPDLNNTYLPDYEGGIAILLVNDTVTFGDFLTENIEDTTVYSIDENQSIVFSYLIEQEFSAGDNFVEIDDFTKFQSIPGPGATPIPFPRDTVITIQETITFDFPTSNGEQVDSLYYAGGAFTLFMDSRYPFPISYEFSTNSFLELASANPIYFTDDIGPRLQSSQSQDLLGYKSLLTPVNGVNEFEVLVTANISLSQGDQLDGTEELIVQIGVENPDLDVIFGYFDKDTFDIGEQSVDLDFFDDLGGEGIEFEAPNIEFTVQNSFGIPVTLDFGSVYATYAEDDDLMLMGDNLKEISAPETANFGTTAISVLSIDNTNSNLRDILAGSPTSMVLPLVGYTNSGDVTSNFLSKESNIAVDAKVSIPLKLKMDGFEYEEVFELDGAEDLEGTKELSMLFNTVNELPFTGSIDLYMLDEDSVVLGSLLNQDIFTAPDSYNANGKVSSPSENSTNVVLDEQLIDALVNATEMKVVVRVNSYDSQNGNFIEVFADYDLQLKIGIAGDISLDLNGN
ncbi:MAG: hypothetical protein JXR10_18110 [Cyclobacteriaceae bacterium]